MASQHFPGELPFVELNEWDTPDEQARTQATRFAGHGPTRPSATLDLSLPS